MQSLEIIVLAIVQGVSEFLPISSDGHLVIVTALWDELTGVQLPNQLEIEIVLHAGTLLSILVVYRKQLVRLLTDDRRQLGLIAVGTLPTVVVGLPMHEIDVLHDSLESPLLTGCMLPLNGLLVLWALRRREGDIDLGSMTYRHALLIGLAQSVAILPGISRSGATISAALGVGLKRQKAATFSFLLAIPAILGAITLTTIKLVTEPAESLPIGMLVVGAAVSFVVGIGALLLLLKCLERGRLDLCAYWCITVGVAFLAWQVLA